MILYYVLSQTETMIGADDIHRRKRAAELGASKDASWEEINKLSDGAEHFRGRPFPVRTLSMRGAWCI